MVEKFITCYNFQLLAATVQTGRTEREGPQAVGERPQRGGH